VRLTQLEFIAMNNPIRRSVQKRVEFRLFNKFLEKHGIDLTGGVILDVGCGSGYGTELIRSRYNPKELVAFDLMPEQIEIARKKYGSARYYIGDVTKISSPSEKYDAVFVFGILHHVPGWKEALREIHRVLKSGGVLLTEEVSGDLGDFWGKYLHFRHPEESRFSWQQFVEGLEAADFDILEDSKILLNVFRSFLCVKSVAGDGKNR